MNRTTENPAVRLILLLALMLGAFIIAGSPAEAEQKFNVKQFGATGNGVTDDTVALQHALAAANAVPGSTLLFPAGNYLYSSAITATSINISGQSATLTSTSGFAVLIFTGHGTVRNMTFATTANSFSAIVVQTASNFQIVNNTFRSGLQFDVLVNQSTNGHIQSNLALLTNSATSMVLTQSNFMTVTGNSYSCDTGDCGGVVATQSDDLTVSSNEATGLQQCILIANSNKANVSRNKCTHFTTGGCAATTNTNVTIAENQFVGTAAALSGVTSEHNQNVLISHNTVQNSELAVLVEDDQRTQITENSLSNASIEAITLEGGSTLNATSNSIKNCRIGIDAFDGAANVTMYHNLISGCNQSGIFASGAAGVLTISGNSLRDCGLLAPLIVPAVILVDCPAATSIPITENTYAGNTTNLQYFIRCLQTQPPAHVSGNRTNTLLPNLVGP